MSLQVHTSQSPDWDEAAWDAFVDAHPHGHFLQLSGWGRFKAAFGWESVRVGVVEHNRLVAGAQILLRPLARVPLAPRFAYIPKGPVVDWSRADLLPSLFEAIHAVARTRRAAMLRMEPERLDSPDLRAQLQSLGFTPSRAIQPRTTVWVDLTPDEATILKRMKQKWRYNVRLAARKGVVVREGDAHDLDAFIALMQITGSRKAFGVHTPDYYRTFWHLFAPTGRAVLLLAEFEGKPLAAIMVGYTGSRAYYFYGASGNQHRNLMPSHLLQWEAMRWARARGCTKYDLWGVPDAVADDPNAAIPDPPEGMWGVWRFKRGFGGQVVRYVGAWDKGYWPGAIALARRMHL
ncbi:MAG TPA: peptidoglycan bridge formation glycyltransferase FemA/FemB family protein [Anaerolineae bacterium]|nr:peptidoglycan bridge formation glycyltransferase FemA/FemB family protein [Anaerolineae bacterium]